MNRYRMLYFIVTSGRVRDEPGLNGRLTRLFGYKSDGHFYADWNVLLDNNLIERKDGFISATAKGRHEFSLIIGARFVILAMLTMGTVLFGYAVGVELGYLRFQIVIVLIVSGTLLGFGLSFYEIYLRFVPKLPSKKESRSSKL